VSHEISSPDCINHGLHGLGQDLFRVIRGLLLEEVRERLTSIRRSA